MSQNKAFTQQQARNMVRYVIMRVAIQGIAGSFHYQAAHQLFPSETIELIECVTFRDVFEAIEANEADTGIVAVENSLHGSINPVYRLLADKKLVISGETRLHVALYLLAHTKLDLKALNSTEVEVMSQREALSQCEQWLRDNIPNARITEANDTAAAVRFVTHNKSELALAIAGKPAAQLYKASVIAGPINDELDNYTRFFAIASRAKPSPDANRTSIILQEQSLDNAGSLHQALSVFADLKINLSKLDSHPLPGKKRTYAFYIDFDVSAESKQGKQALEQLAQQGWQVQLLGSYQAHDEAA